MLRNFYLLCIIIYVKDTVCYDRIKLNRHLISKRDKRLRETEDSNNENNKIQPAHVIQRRQGKPNENEQFAQIDVASFIQKPDSYADDDRLLSQQYNFNNQPIPKHFNNYEDFNNVNSYMKVKEDNLNMDDLKNLKSNEGSPAHKDLNYFNGYHFGEFFTNSKENGFHKDDFKNIFESEIGSDNIKHVPYKKSSRQDLNNLKFPFFFRRQNNLPKLSDANSTKKHQYKLDLYNYIDTYNNENLLQRGIKKRANKEYNYLKSKKEKDKIRNDKRGLGHSIFHNSRQYYQKLMSDSKSKKVTKDPKIENKENETTKIETMTTTTNMVHKPQSAKNNIQDEKKMCMIRKKKANHMRKKLAKYNKNTAGV